MANQTLNFGFTKPEINDVYDVNVQNENWDKLDEELGGTVPITRGGTGSTSATAALANLGAAKSNHKHTATDINSGTFSSDRFPVIPISKGGTGAADSSKARENLGITQEYWTFTLDDGTTVTKLVCAT